MNIDDAKARMLDQIVGAGIEIGAYRNPLPVRNGTVRYVDLFTPEQAARMFPESDDRDGVVTPDIIAPADDLGVLEDKTLDFVLTSHVLEHLPDPIKALKEWHRTLKPGGMMLLILPDKRNTFDLPRPYTPLTHLIQDHQEDAESDSRKARDREHFREWARWVNGMRGDAQVELWADLLHRAGYPIHYHCWRLSDLLDLTEHLREEEGLPLEVVDTAEAARCFEFALLLRRSG